MPERLRKQVYGDDYNDTWKLRYSGLSDSEKRTLGTFLKYQEVKEIYWIPEVDSPSGKHSPDLLIDGVKVEIKEVTSSSSISHQVKKSSTQINTTGLLLMDASGSELVDESICRRALMEATQYSIKSFAVVSNDRLLSYSIKKGDSSTANHTARDHESPYVSILPNSGQKVNRIFIQYKKGDSVTAAKRGHDHESPYTSILPNPGAKSQPDFYTIPKRRFIHRKLQVLATMNRLMFLSYQTLGKSQSSSEIYPITFREYVGYINTKKYSQMKGKAVPPNSIRRGRNIYTFYKKNKGDKIYWVGHEIIRLDTNELDVIDGELLISFDHHTMLNLWCDYPWKFTPEQKALFDKENPYWADFFDRRNGTEPPIVDENGVGTMHFND